LYLQETQVSLTNRGTRLEVSQGHQTWYHSIWYHKYGFLLLCYSNFVRIRYSTSKTKLSWP